MKRVIIFRGLPGSGKSTLAKKLGGFVVSADDYFMVDGVYRFDPSKLGEAHIACMRNFLYACGVDMPLIAVDNTNTTLMELNPYRLVALAHGYEVEVHRVICNPEVAFKRGTHNVPLNTIKRMDIHFETLPSFMGSEKAISNA